MKEESMKIDDKLEIPEPGPEVLALKDREGDAWRRTPGGWQLPHRDGRPGNPVPWSEVAVYAPFTVTEVREPVVVAMDITGEAYRTYCDANNDTVVVDFQVGILKALELLGIHAVAGD